MERAGPEVDDAQHIHNKALFDAVNQALKLLLPPYGPQLTSAQRRVRREQPGSHRWQAAVGKEAAKQVCTWAAPREEDDLDALLLEDILKVRDVFKGSSHPVQRPASQSLLVNHHMPCFGVGRPDSSAATSRVDCNRTRDRRHLGSQLQ